MLMETLKKSPFSSHWLPSAFSSVIQQCSTSSLKSSSLLSPSGTIFTHGSAILATVSVYKFFVFLALLSLIPSSPPSITMASMVKEAELQKIFKLRNENDWKSLWHSEKHVRCRDQLLTHMDWACQKDIYRLEKRFKNIPRAEHEPQSEDNDPFGDVFIRKSLAETVIKPWNGYIRRKREEKSITDECCSAAGCSWEEYAEYCPAHRRIQTRHVSRRK